MEWIRGSIIGRGSTATVSLATTVPSGQLFAVKSAELSRSMFLQKEQYFLSQLCCPHIVEYIGFDVSYEGNKPMYNLWMEYVPGGTLYDAIQRHQGRLDEAMIRVYTKQILQGLEYLHANGLVHCDIKSQNILIGKDGSKIADLGCAKLVGKVAGNGDSSMSALSGTPMFMAPEVARGEEQGFPADVWALGCTIIEMATGSSPWPEMNDPVSVLYRIGFSADVLELPRGLSERAKDFLSKCLMRDPRERWTAKELLEHPFLAENDSYSIEVKELNMSSPNSVLDHGFWESMNVLEGRGNQTQESNSSNSPSERIRMLIGGTMPSDWTWNEDWITVRSDVIEEDENSVETALIMGPGTQLEVFGSSMFDEDLFEYSANHRTSTFSRISIRIGLVTGCESVNKDDIVLIISYSEIDNETQFFPLNSIPIQYNLILFVTIYLLYKLRSLSCLVLPAKPR
ncbi:mitogen-activated protein kinase kinase kinase 18-like [Juglans microcarpa x Juglans regia]|uniref:mitogen-activated protein kinase kinase kinase 18-like n=1 Tax=Juglans microcarpa x Juglans regia TaxID=2249226 RepID=UPI001B7F64AF|nr:mitogen-activated protein kinase kinase kinase 18-like [Juglans microcarpa x Juglans regia]